MHRRTASRIFLKPGHAVLLLSFLALSASLAAEKKNWWDKQWSLRKEFVLDTSDEGAKISDPIGSSPVLVRLHDGNFQFLAAREDGGDIRFVAADGQTLLPFQIEKFDPLFNEGFVWVGLSDVKPGEKVSFWLYYGNAEAGPEAVEEPGGVYDKETVSIYHFAERAAPPADSVSKNNAAPAGAPVEGALIGTGLRLLGGVPLVAPPSPSLEWPAEQPLTWSAWFKQTALQDQGILWSRVDGDRSVRVGVDQGVPFVEVGGADGVKRSPAGEPIAASAWRHLAFAADEKEIRLYLDGKLYSTLEQPLPALAGSMAIGGDDPALADGPPSETGFVGELDEMQISKVARPAGWIELAAIGQGGQEAAGKLLTFGEEEGGAGHNETMEHMMLFGDIARNMMFDGWIAVGICALMILTGWTVAVQKFLYLGKIQKGNDEFLRQWKKVAADLTVLDSHKGEGGPAFHGEVSKRVMRWVRQSPLYHLYHIGSDEILHRMGHAKKRAQGLSARSMQAIRASLDAGLVREHHRLNKGIVLLTISIAGGPYVGLLGTVVGVMITFALIAKTGEVDVNSIAPGIASALLATTAGLAVAIPALFMYSYLNSRIHETISSMQVFIDEFIAKIAEFYPPPSEAGGPFVPVPAAAAGREEHASETKKT